MMTSISCPTETWKKKRLESITMRTIRERQVKTTMRFHLTSFRMIIIHKAKNAVKKEVAKRLTLSMYYFLSSDIPTGISYSKLNKLECFLSVFPRYQTLKSQNILKRIHQSYPSCFPNKKYTSRGVPSGIHSHNYTVV